MKGEDTEELVKMENLKENDDWIRRERTIAIEIKIPVEGCVIVKKKDKKEKSMLPNEMEKKINEIEKKLKEKEKKKMFFNFR